MKKNYITRTIQFGNYEVMGINLETTQVETTRHNIPSYQRIKDPLKYFSNLMDTSTYKVVSAKFVESTEILFGMTEDDFIANGEVMKSRRTSED